MCNTKIEISDTWLSIFLFSEWLKLALPFIHVLKPLQLLVQCRGGVCARAAVSLSPPASCWHGCLQLSLGHRVMSWVHLRIWRPTDSTVHNLGYNWDHACRHPSTSPLRQPPGYKVDITLNVTCSKEYKPMFKF